MANSASIQGSNVNHLTANGATLDIAIPTCAAGDTFVVHACAANSSPSTWSAAVLSPAHSLGAPTLQPSRASLDSPVWVYTAQTGDSGGTLRITNGVSGRLIAGTLLVLRNVGALEAIPAFTSSTVGSINPVAPSITPSGADDTIITLYAENDIIAKQYTANWPGGVVVVQENTGTPPASGVTIGTYCQLDRTSASATGTLTGTCGIAGQANQWTAATIAFRAKVANQPPVADAGPTQTVAAGASVTLDGSGSVDPDGTIASYAWTQTSGTTVSLSGSGVQQPTFTAPSLVGGDTLIFSLTVTDNLGATSSADTVTITVQGTGGGASLGLRGSSIAGNPGNNPGLVASAVVPSAIVDGDQILVFMVAHVVSATDPLTGPAGYTLVGTANWGSNQYGVWRKTAVASTDGGATVSVTWPVTNGKWQMGIVVMKGASATLADFQVFSGTALAPATAHPAPSLAAGGVSGCWRLDVAVDVSSPPSTALTPSATPAPPQVILGGGAQQFYENGGGAFAFAMGGAGPVSGTGTITGGTWTGTVSTNNALIMSVLVKPSATNLPPVANAGAAQTNIEPFDVVTLDGSGSSDPEAQTITYAWTQLSGQAVTLSSATAQRPTFTAPGLRGTPPGTNTVLVFGLVVTDNGSPPASSPQATVQITVLPAYRFLAHAGSWQAKQRLQPHSGTWR